VNGGGDRAGQWVGCRMGMATRHCKLLWCHCLAEPSTPDMHQAAVLATAKVYACHACRLRFLAKHQHPPSPQGIYCSTAAELYLPQKVQAERAPTRRSAGLPLRQLRHPRQRVATHRHHQRTLCTAQHGTAQHGHSAARHSAASQGGREAWLQVAATPCVNQAVDWLVWPFLLLASCHHCLGAAVLLCAN